MKKEIELAKQAGWEYADDDRGFEPLWRFAELVRADERAKLQPKKIKNVKKDDYCQGDERYYANE
jgi:hypothetical protein